MDNRFRAFGSSLYLDDKFIASCADFITARQLAIILSNFGLPPEKIPEWDRIVIQSFLIGE